MFYSFIMLTKQITEKIIERQAEVLGIAKPRIRFNRFSKIYAKPAKNLLSIDLCELNRSCYADLYNAELWNHIALTSYRKRIRFILGHEVGHIYHFQKHFNHFQKYKVKASVKAKLNHADYRKMKKEKIADKIGLILLKKYFQK